MPDDAEKVTVVVSEQPALLVSKSDEIHRVAVSERAVVTAAAIATQTVVSGKETVVVVDEDRRLPPVVSSVGGGSATQAYYERRHSFVAETDGSTTDYIGQAAKESSDSSTVWTVRRLVFSQAGALVSREIARSIAWVDRESATYTPEA